jgi:ribose-phosphate pyrophosphokinase
MKAIRREIDMMIIGGPASQLLARRVATILDEELALVQYKTFPDGESYSQIVDNLEDDVVIIQSTPKDSDIIYLLQLLDICRDKKVSLVIPYFGYARQDRALNPGMSIAGRAIASALNPFLGVSSKIFTVNIHAQSVLSHFRCPSKNFDATPYLADEVHNLGLSNPIVISPDKGAIAMAKTAALLLGAECDYLEKKRLSETEVSLSPKEVEVIGRDVVIFDDIISTGETIATAIKLLRKQGAKSVFLATVHPVLAGNAILKLYHSGAKIILATDTLDKGISTVSVAPLIADSIRSLI